MWMKLKGLLSGEPQRFAFLDASVLSNSSRSHLLNCPVSLTVSFAKVDIRHDRRNRVSGCLHRLPRFPSSPRQFPLQMLLHLSPRLVSSWSGQLARLRHWRWMAVLRIGGAAIMASSTLIGFVPIHQSHRNRHNYLPKPRVYKHAPIPDLPGHSVYYARNFA